MVFEFLGLFFAWTWFIWAPVFVCSLVAAIRRALQPQDEGRPAPLNWPLFWAALSFSAIVGGFASLIFMTA